MSKKSSLVRLIGILFLSLLVIPSLECVPRTLAVDIDDVRDELFSAFEVVSDAEAKGGDVADLVDELNAIVQLIESASEDDFSELLDRVLSVSRDAVAAGNVGESTGSRQFSVSITIMLVTILLIVLVWALTPVVYWKLWLRSKKGWVVYS